MPPPRPPRTVLITGANRGIGLEAARVVAGAGDRVLLGSRNRDAGEDAARSIRTSTGNEAVEVVCGDLWSREGVRAVAEGVLARTERLDVLVHNAATVARKRVITPDGLELQFAVNHLAPFLLTRLLLPLLHAATPARVVTVASRAHRRGRIRWDDLQGEGRYSAMGAYGQSKLANLLFTAELARRLEGTGISAVSLHPGVYGTGLLATLVGPLGGLVRRLVPGPETGGAVLARLALADDLSADSGTYFEQTVPVLPSRAARNDEDARRLWEVSEALAGG